jgi:hypothetical protein
VSGRRQGQAARSQVSLALWGVGVVLFNFPMLIVWDRDAAVLGLPLLPVAIFSIWAVLIAVLAWASERRQVPHHALGNGSISAPLSGYEAKRGMPAKAEEEPAATTPSQRRARQNPPPTAR